MKSSALLAFTASAMAASLAVAAIPPAGASSKLGFLLATRSAGCSGDNSCGARFETRLLVLDGEKMDIAVQTPHLYVPRNTGFWEVGAIVPKSALKSTAGSAQEGSEGEGQEGQEPSSSDWQLWAAPIGKNPAFPPPPTAENDNSEESGNELRSISFDWAGTDYISVTEEVGEYTNSPSILSIDGIARNAAEPWKPTISQAAYEKDIADCVDEKSDFNNSAFLQGADQAWGISRGKMRWEFTWAFGYSGGVERGYSTACATSQRPPKVLVGNDALGVGWNQVLARVPEARTAFSSPDRSSILVITGNQVLALKRDGNVLSSPYARVFFQSGQIVSAQWAVGKYADGWAEQLSHAKSWLDNLQPATSH